MPNVRKSGGRRRRGTVRRRTTTKRSLAVRRVPRIRGLTSGFPERKIVTLKYCSQHMLPGGAGLFAGSHTFSTNSVYDPDYSAIGHQPYGYDTWAGLYGRYEVLQSMIRVQFVTSQGYQNVLAAIILTNDVDSTTTLDLVRERPGAYCKLVTCNRPVTITRSWKFNKDSPNHAGWDNTASVGNSPPQNDYYRVYVSNVDGASALTQNSVACLVEIRYVVKFWERANLGLS